MTRSGGGSEEGDGRDSLNVMDSLRGEGCRGRIGARGSQRKKEKGSSVGRMGLGESEELSGMTECPAAWCHPFEWSPLCHQTCVLLCAEDPSPITVGRSTGDHQADHCSPLLGDESRGQRLGLPSTFHHQPDPENQSDLSSNSTHTAHLGDSGQVVSLNSAYIYQIDEHSHLSTASVREGHQHPLFLGNRSPEN